MMVLTDNGIDKHFYWQMIAPDRGDTNKCGADATMYCCYHRIAYYGTDRRWHLQTMALTDDGTGI